MVENREASYARETVQPPKTVLDRLSYVDIAKRPLAVATALDKNPDAEKIASKILGKEPKEHETNPTTLSENQDVREIQSKIYAELGIDMNTDTNNPIKKLGKGVIDGLIIGNAEIVAKIQKDGMSEFLSSLKAQLTTLEGWQKIAEALGKSVLELFSGDAYKTGKSVAELGLITTGMGATGSLVKMVGKQAVKASVKIGTETAAKEVATVAAYGAGKTLEKTGDALQVPAKTIAKASEIAIAGVKKVGEVSGVNQVLKKGTEAIKDTIEAAGVSKVVEGTKNAVKRSLQGLSAVHIVGSAEGFPRHPKTAEAGAIFPEGKPSLNGEKPKEPYVNNQEPPMNEPTSPKAEDPREKGLSPEKLAESAKLYEKHPYLTEYKDFLGPLSLERMVGMGNNGIIIRHPEDLSKVVKISNGKIDSHKLEGETKTHDRILDLVIEGQEKGLIPNSARVPTTPFIVKINEKNIMVMEHIVGQSFMIKAYLDGLEHSAKTYTLKHRATLEDVAKMREMTDYQVMDYMEKNYKISSDAFLKEGGEAVNAGIWEVNREVRLAKYATDGTNPISKLRGYLFENGIELTDAHGGNFMYGRDGTTWAIDFGMVGVARMPAKK